MFKFLRKNIKHIVAISALLIIPTFILWGIGSAVRSKKETQGFAGTIFARDISFEEFYKSFNVIRSSFERDYPGQLPDEFIIAMTWNRLILLEEAHKRKISITNNDIAKKIAQIPQFQTNGAFDIGLYRDILKERARFFEEQIRNDLLIQKLKEQIVSRDVRLSDDEVKTEYKNQNEKAKISYILVSTDSQKAQATFTDEEIASYFDSHKEDFKKPTEVNLEYVEIAPELIDKIDEAISKDITDLKKLSEQFSFQIRQTGFFGPNDPIPGIGFVLDVYRDAFKLKPNKMSQPIETPNGYVLIEVKQTRKDYIPTLTEAKEKIKEILITQKAKKEAEKLIQQYYDSIKEAKSLEEACKTLGIELKQTQEFTRKDYIPNIGPAQSLKELVFSARAGDISNVVEVETGFCIFRLDEIIPIDEEKFKQEKDAFYTQLLNTRQDEYFNKWFETLKSQANLRSNL